MDSPYPYLRQFGPHSVSRPVVLSVPHAGRDYPAHLLPLLRHPLSEMMCLEDRHADSLIEHAESAGISGVVACAPRLIIDLNRDGQDVDPEMFREPVPHASRLSAKARGGLGLIPRRTATLGELWRTRLSRADLDHRITAIHQPYHQTLQTLLRAVRAKFENAVLLDIHSMPSLTAGNDHPAADIVIGDLYGCSAHSRFTDILATTARAHGLNVAINTPYPGNHILAQHGAPARGIHAIQIEFDRRLYLDAALHETGPGLSAMQKLILMMTKAVEAECLPMTDADYSMAAE
jgi:N-formylglutamate amidohydrolase